MQDKKKSKKTLFIIIGLFALVIIFIYAAYASVFKSGGGLFNPHAGEFALSGALLLALILGLIHGITPDEHTWPITFSYAIGSYTTKKGALAGFLFSLGFTIQRAFMSELSYLFLAPFLRSESINGAIYLIVGAVMALSGMYILKKGKYLHIHAISSFFENLNHKIFHKAEYKNSHVNAMEEHDAFKEHDLLADSTKPIPLKLTVVHGLIAGFGFGAFALILYTIISPSMPNAYVAWVPGALFGIGTMIMQILFGALIGEWLQHKDYTQTQITFISRTTSGNMLAYGGLAFVIGGIFLLTLPNIAGFSIGTGLGIPNLDSINIGLVLVLCTVVIVAIPSYLHALGKAKSIKGKGKK